MTSSFSRRIDVRGVDRSGFQIQGLEFEWFVNGALAGKASTNGQTSLDVLDHSASVSIKARYNGIELGPIILAASQSSYTFRFDIDVYPHWRVFAMKHFAALVGIFFILLAVVLVFVFDHPNRLQSQIVLAMFSLGGGGFGGEIAGFINTNLTLGTKLKIAAGGAAAIFVVLYFFVPAGVKP